jgi:hypothetical protein
MTNESTLVLMDLAPVISLTHRLLRGNPMLTAILRDLDIDGVYDFYLDQVNMGTGEPHDAALRLMEETMGCHDDATELDLTRLFTSAMQLIELNLTDVDGGKGYEWSFATHSFNFRTHLWIVGACNA